MQGDTVRTGKVCRVGEQEGVRTNRVRRAPRGRACRAGEQEGVRRTSVRRAPRSAVMAVEQERVRLEARDELWQGRLGDTAAGSRVWPRRAESQTDPGAPWKAGLARSGLQAVEEEGGPLGFCSGHLGEGSPFMAEGASRWGT